MFAANTLDNNLNGLIFISNKAKPVVGRRQENTDIMRQPICLYYRAAPAFLLRSVPGTTRTGFGKKVSTQSKM
jgi:hypothetical protein